MKATVVIFFLTIAHLVGAQSQKEAPEKIQPLKIGDQCPDFIFSNLINSTNARFRLSDLRGKVVILDFWATWCGPCISGLLRADSLQQQFADRLQIIPVTSEDRNHVIKFLSVNKALKDKKVFTVTQDNILRQYFNYREIPHEVWIDPQGYVRAITGIEEVTSTNIEKAVSQLSFDFSPKKDVLGRPYMREPLLLGGLGEDYPVEKILPKYSSFITGRLEGMPGLQLGAHPIGGSTRILAVNNHVDALYRLAFGLRQNNAGAGSDSAMFLRFPSRIIWEAKDSTLFNWPGRSKPDWATVPDSAKTFSYEILVPQKDSSNVWDYMLEDLNRYFGRLCGIQGYKEKRKVKCWVLSRIDTITPPVSKMKTEKIIIDENRDTITAEHIKISKFLFYWMSFQPKIHRSVIPIVDGTGYTELIDFNIHADVNSIESVSKALKAYGFEFRPAEREIEMIVIRDKIENSSSAGPNRQN